MEVNAQMSIRMGEDSPLRKLQIAEIATNNLYVDSVDEAKLVEDAIRGMLEKLDPHSTYSNAKEVKQMNEPLNGNFEGIGVQFNMIDDTLMVIQPVTNGPSEKVGIIAGDRIVSVNDTAIAGVKILGIFDRIVQQISNDLTYSDFIPPKCVRKFIINLNIIA